MAKIKILIAEDDKDTLELYRKGLTEDLFEMRFAINGKDALDLYQEWHPHIIVLDIVMPVMTGYSVLKEIREKIKDRATKIVMATSLSTRHDIMDCSKLGIQGYIIKPFQYKEIGSIIANYLKRTGVPQA
jgi:DNA-binding response OmpR family regulator